MRRRRAANGARGGTVTDDGHGASEVAQALAGLVLALPEQTVTDLHGLLAHTVAAPSPAQIRESRVGLLLTLVADSPGEVPTVERYETERKRREGSGENWPAHSTLIRAYGHWLAAVRAAMRLQRDGGRARVPRSHHHARLRTGYTREQVMGALRTCADALGSWPTEWEYEEWARLRREAARLAGLPEPTLPVLKPIRTLFGS
jgi:hypothetical protein